MANYREIARRFPAVRSYLENRLWVRRGDVTAYGADVACAEFSTDRYGFRHVVAGGDPVGLEAAFSGERFGVLLGASNLFGFGLSSNEETIASRLSARTGAPCLNVCFPEADLRTLQSSAARILGQAPRAPDFVVCLVGGTLSRYCYSRRCDPLFGLPDFLVAEQNAPRVGDPAETAAFDALLGYTGFWLDQLTLALRGAPLVVLTETSAFEKAALDESETACEITTPANEVEAARFATHRARYPAFRESWLSATNSRAITARTEPDALSFIDEVHVTAAGADRIAADLAAALETAEARP